MTTTHKPPFQLFIFLSIIAIACTSSNTKNQNILPYKVDIEKNIKNIKSITLSELGKKVEYIPLETTPNSLIRRIIGIQFSEEFIFISDFDRLLQFDRVGKFIRQVGDNGRGPGEYIHVSDFWIDEMMEKVYVMAWGISTIKEYDFYGNFLNSFKLDFSSLQFVKTGNDTYTFVITNAPFNFNKDSEFRLIETDSTGTIKSKFRNYNRVYNIPPFIVTKIPMYYFNDTIRINESRVDTLNSFINGRHIPYAIFNFGIYKMNPDLTREELNNQLMDKLWIWTIHENNAFLFLEFKIGISDSSAYGIYNKENSETAFLKKGFEDDLGIGIPFWPKYVYHDSLLVDYQDAYKIIDVMNRPLKEIDGTKSSRPFKGLYKLQETSNPVLILLNSDK